jgi:HTH-type transcriptional regulator, sugar sensing transcriptional regulator
MDRDPGTVERLVELGFSQYEARAYVGLLGAAEPMTGYALSNATGVPQPKVYETLRRLARKGVAVMLGGEPARFVALPPAQLISQLDASFRRRLADAELALLRQSDESEVHYRVVETMDDWAAVEDRAIALLDGAHRHAYLSLNCEHCEPTLEAVRRADRRGVRVDVLLFGKETLDLEHGRVIRHESTEGVVYRHHQARHLALVADSTEILWALAPDGGSWDAVTGDDALLAAALKGYVRHDMYVQQIVTEFGRDLADRYGPGLEQLVMPRDGAEPVLGEAADRRPSQRPAAKRRRRTA